MSRNESGEGEKSATSRDDVLYLTHNPGKIAMGFPLANTVVYTSSEDVTGSTDLDDGASHVVGSSWDDTPECETIRVYHDGAREGELTPFTPNEDAPLGDLVGTFGFSIGHRSLGNFINGHIKSIKIYQHDAFCTTLIGVNAARDL